MNRHEPFCTETKMHLKIKTQNKDVQIYMTHKKDQNMYENEINDKKRSISMRR